MKTFEELGVAPQIIRAITEMGYESPMPVQEEVIPYLLGESNEVIALAQTGTGKTAAFGLPILQQIRIDQVQPQAVVLCPTRELCLQIADDLNDYSKYIDHLKVLPVYGGSSIDSQIRALRRGVHVIVATPGRLIDLINRKTADLQAVRNVILDEADEMLNMGFSESIDEILSHVPKTRNMLLFSATMPSEIAKITKKYMRNPHEIIIGKKNEGAKNVRHLYYMVNAKDKYLVLKRLADYNPNIYGIVFCRTKKETQEIADLLIKDGYNADSLHGDLSQAQRDYVMQKFRLRNIQLLVATDVAARGLDVDDLTHVINYGLPDDVESYTHRSGRTGRAGKTGTSVAIIHLKEKSKIKAIEKNISKTFEQGAIPSGKQICEKQLFSFIDKLEKVSVNEEEIQDLLPSIYRKLDWLDKEDIIKRLISNEFNRLIEYYQIAGEIEMPQEGKRNRENNAWDRESRGSGKGTGRASEKGYARLFINLGKKDGIGPQNIIGLLNDNVQGRKIGIGKIDLLKNFSFFEVHEADRNRVIQGLVGVKAFGQRLAVELAQPSPSDDRKQKIERSQKSDRPRDFKKKYKDDRKRKS
ncbi:MAG: ATP-dependent RNA helicase DeaD [Candidatus Ordinivivax streblomastigis]|uniref:ATP-dependent RNA helicase DeaD n=1 Tax=Candidatus Ordinivivax streblomastigis TaxID=2540710 RepID=A0A5M8P109_9BACT|nr:MAG: ATP-dependent RNA helicase DeaD [Candidatus Ordinivivax streblomastigis]